MAKPYFWNFQCILLYVKRESQEGTFFPIYNRTILGWEYITRGLGGALFIGGGACIWAQPALDCPVGMMHGAPHGREAEPEAFLNAPGMNSGLPQMVVSQNRGTFIWTPIY